MGLDSRDSRNSSHRVTSLPVDDQLSSAIAAPPALTHGVIVQCRPTMSANEVVPPDRPKHHDMWPSQDGFKVKAIISQQDAREPKSLSLHPFARDARCRTAL